MTIDEIIAHEKDVADHIYIEIMLCHTNPDDEKLDERIKEGKYHEQIVELLEDYKRVKKWKDDVIDEICKYDANSIGELVYNARQKTINEFAERLKDSLMSNYKHLLSIDDDGFAWLTTDAVETHIDSVTEQLKAGVTGD